jgi:hypothetical protein
MATAQPTRSGSQTAIRAIHGSSSTREGEGFSSRRGFVCSWEGPQKRKSEPKNIRTIEPQNDEVQVGILALHFCLRLFDIRMFVGSLFPRTDKPHLPGAIDEPKKKRRFHCWKRRLEKNRQGAAAYLLWQT